MSIREVGDAIQKIREVVEKWNAAGETEWMEEHAKNSLSYLAICQIRAMAIWTKLL